MSTLAPCHRSPWQTLQQQHRTRGGGSESDLMTRFDRPGPATQPAAEPWSILDDESASLLGLLDPTEAFRVVAAGVPAAPRLEVAWRSEERRVRQDRRARWL